MEDKIVLTREQFEEECADNYFSGHEWGRKTTATEILTHLKNRQLVDKYELNKLAEKYGVELKD